MSVSRHVDMMDTILDCNVTDTFFANLPGSKRKWKEIEYFTFIFFEYEIAFFCAEVYLRVGGEWKADRVEIKRN